jgi:hypothetical protein
VARTIREWGEERFVVGKRIIDMKRAGSLRAHLNRSFYLDLVIGENRISLNPIDKLGSDREKMTNVTCRIVKRVQ